MGGEGEQRELWRSLWRQLAAVCTTAGALAADVEFSNIDLSNDWGKLSLSYLVILALGSCGLWLAISGWKRARGNQSGLPSRVASGAVMILCVTVSGLVVGTTLRG